MNNFLLLSFSLLLTFCVLSASASIQNFSTNKSLYHEGDSIIITGTVNLNPEIPSIILQVITPSGNGLAHIANVIPKSDGSFTKSINAGGPTWSEDGDYTIKLTYGENLEKNISYEKLPPSSTPPSAEPNPTPSPKTNPPIVSSENESIETPFFNINPKMQILGFPSFDKSPQYYIDRYNTESQYRSWFDSQFPDHTIVEVVGYDQTHIENFPSFDKSPQYYIDRYNTESQYRSWFDSQFPNQTIFDVLGFSTYIPNWIKTYAKNWSTGQITDGEFMSGLDFMLENKIITISGIDHKKTSVDEIPSWFRNTANWWSNNQISQQEFINSIKYLIQEDIILLE